MNSLDAINAEPDRYAFLGMVDVLGVSHAAFHDNQSGTQVLVKCPYGQPGDRLWVRETAALLPKSVTYSADKMVYRTTASEGEAFAVSQIGGWKPSIFMKRAASRLLLEITAVRVERVQDISETDAVAEGIEVVGKDCWGLGDPYYRCYTDPKGDVSFGNPVASYDSLWKKINGPGSWAANPWVWVVEFKVVQGGKEVASA